MFVDLAASLKPIIFVYKLYGIWIPKKSSNNSRRNTLLAWGLFIWILEMMFFFTQLIYLIAYIKTLSIKELSGIGYVLITVAANLIKKMFTIKNMNTIKHIVENLNRPMFQPKNEEQRQIVSSTTRILSNVYIIYMGAAIVLSFFWLIIPLFEPVKRIPFSAWFPFDTMVTPTFQIIFIYQVVLITYNSILCVNLDTLAVGLLTHIGIQYDCISNRLENLYETSKEIANQKSVSNCSTNEDVGKEMELQLIQCIYHHRVILKFVKDVEGLYDISIVLQFALSIFVLCMTLFRITVVPVVSLEFLFFLIYQIAAMFQIFIYCWFGNEVIFKSKKLYRAAYNLKWVDATNSFKKNLVLFILVTQKIISVRVGGIFVISVETFITILKSSFSYFTFMRKIENKA